MKPNPATTLSMNSITPSNPINFLKNRFFLIFFVRSANYLPATRDLPCENEMGALMFGPPSDISLVKKALKGNGDAWNQLIRRYEGKIFNFALRMTGNREDALDLVQDVFLAVYRNLDRYGQSAKFSSWIFTIASHRATDFYRRKKPIDPLEEGDLQSADDDANPFDQVARRQSNQEILRLLHQLSPEQRLVVELKYFQEQTFEEMSTFTGIPTNTLKSRLYAALRKLKSLPEVVGV